MKTIITQNAVLNVYCRVTRLVDGKPFAELCCVQIKGHKISQNLQKAIEEEMVKLYGANFINSFVTGINGCFS